jgi:hypothetical protein
LRAGIAPRHAGSYVTELREHLADLTERERAMGQESKAAAERARALLGTDTELVQEMIACGTPRSLAARIPWAVFVLLPVVAILLLIVAIGDTMFHIFMAVHALEPTAMPGGYHALFLLVSFTASYLIGPLIALCCIAVALRQRLSSPWVWVGLAFIALVSGVFGFYHSPGAPYEGILHVRVNGHVDAGATLAMIGLRAAVLFTLAAIVYRTLRTRIRPITA